MRRAQCGDRDAFDVLVQRHAGLVIAVARRITGHREDAEDVAQETFLRFYRSLDRVDPQRPVEPWLLRLAINAARTANQCRGGRLESALDEEDRFAAAGVDPSAALGRSDMLRVLRQAIDALPERERLSFLLRDVEQLDVSLVAEALGVSEVTVRRQSVEARRKLATWLRERHPELTR